MTVYSVFIELTRKQCMAQHDDDGMVVNIQKVEVKDLINVNAISRITTPRDGIGSLIWLTGEDDYIEVIESYQEIKEAIKRGMRE